MEKVKNKLLFALLLTPLFVFGQGSPQQSLDVAKNRSVDSVSQSSGRPMVVVKPNEKDKLDIAVIIFGIIGNLAAGFGFYLVVKKERKTRNDVQDLMVLANELKAQNNLMIEQNHLLKMQLQTEAEPDFIVFESKFEDDTFSIVIQNIGQKAYLEGMNSLDKLPESSIIWINAADYKYGRYVRKGEKFSLVIKTKDNKSADDLWFRGELDYLDSYNNKYVAIFGTINREVLFNQGRLIKGKEKS